MTYSTVAAEIWEELRRLVGGADRAEAAEILVSVLVNNDEDAESIRQAFKGDGDIREALKQYLDQDTGDSDDDELDTYLEDVDDPEY